ncbi:S41 family peptidase [Lewinella sp. W8]|uniref:S41 family peptidase n=1 Tax=Lewinella sp. W8 TaxID=2528208 RepID=UPI0010675828|nr:S41 family peptidase [Lewinella sp. W8]MTB50529.1 peptidase S41 [Lewinella sp. W8]
MRHFFTLVLCLLAITLTAQDSPYFVDHPSLTPDGKTIIFTYNGDLWEVPAAGGQANRLTALDGAESSPRVSPDGKWIAFSSSQYGNNDLYLMPFGGGPIRQLSFHESSDVAATWSWDSQTIYFVSSRYNARTTYAISREGGTPKRLFGHYFNTIHNPAIHPSTGELYFNESWESSIFTHRKGYKGPFNPDIKSYNSATGTLTQHTDWEGKDMWPMIDRNGNTYFVSDRDNGEYNLYALRDGNQRRLTRFSSSVFSPSISADGSAIAFIRDYQLHLFDTAIGKSRLVPITLNAFAGLTKSQDFTTDGKLTAFDVAKDGKKLAFVSRGELFVSDMEGKFIRQMETGTGRVLEVKWLKDGKTLLFNQTKGGYQNLYRMPADGSAAPTAITNDTKNNRNLEMSHDTSRVAYLSGRNEVRVLNLDNFTTELVARDELWGFYNDFPLWSPDDRYLMYTAYRDFENDIFLVDLENDNEVKNLTNTGVSESGPVWSPDGRYIYFSSARRQPSYPRGGGNQNLYRLPLHRYEAPYRTEKFDALFSEEKEEKDSVVVSIDYENIMERLEQVGPGFGTQGGAYVIEEKGKTIVLYGSNHEGGRTKLYKTVYEDFESPKTEEIKGQGVGGANDLVVVKGKYYLLGGGKVQQINLNQNKLEATELKHTFRRNLNDEFRQMYFETWANLEENFYAEDFHGVDWPALRDQYAKYLPHLTNRADLRRLTNDLLGELNTSHFGFNSSGSEERARQRSRTLSLGLEFAPDDPYRVERVLTDGPADVYGKDIQPGDRLVAVGGESVDPAMNREMYLSRPSIDKEIMLTFARGGERFEVGIHPVNYFQTRTARYDEWMDDNQARVDRQSKSRIAYIHMKNMGGGELNRFLDEMISEGYQREGIILDLRYNTGGNVHDAVLQFLSQRPYLEWAYRGGDRASQPNFAPQAKPVVLLINQQSLSDAEMTTEGFKQLGLGTVVGTPTYRWIIFTSGKGLVDGSFYRLPSWGCYGLDGRNLEKTGVEPDVRIDNTMADRQAGRDPQLDKAIEIIMEQLK